MARRAGNGEAQEEEEGEQRMRQPVMPRTLPGTAVEDRAGIRIKAPDPSQQAHPRVVATVLAWPPRRLRTADGPQTSQGTTAPGREHLLW